MRYTTHYYPAGAITKLVGMDYDQEEALTIECVHATYTLANLRVTPTPVEVIATMTKRMLGAKDYVMEGVLRYHSLNGDFFAHLTFTTPTDLYAWGIHYKTFVVAFPQSIKDKLNTAEAHTHLTNE